MWNKKDRMLAVLGGEKADRAPVSCWRHFLETEHDGADFFAKSMLDFQNKYDWDYLKMQPRASYYEEAWGGEYDYNNYQGVLPSCTKTPINNAQDLEKVVELSGTHSTFGEQVEAVKLIQKGIKDDTPIFQTMMCPTSVLQKLCNVNPIGRHREASRSDLMVTLMHENPDLVHKALKNITRTMANFSQELIDINTFGVFYGATGLSRTGYLTMEEWEEFVKPYDLELLDALKPTKVMLHACGIDCNPERFANYPIDILHWPESDNGNPALNSAPEWLSKNITPMGGVDERLFGEGKVEEIANQTRNTIKKMQEIPFMLSPDCSLSIDTRDEEMDAFLNAALEK